MEENILKVFALSTARYFDQVAAGGAILGTPYLRADGELVALDYAAIIGISGAYHGGVYYTAPHAKLEKLLPMIGEVAPDPHLCADLIGEIANSIAGNAREHLGAGFMISPPFVLTGRSGDVQTPKGAPCYVLPVTWNGHVSRVLVTIQSVEGAGR